MPRGAKAKPPRASKARVAPSTKPQPAGASLVLQADCTLREAASLKSRLLAHVSHGARVTLEGGGVQRIDTAGLQLLVAFAQRQAAANRQLAWTSVSDELREASAWLGLESALSLPARAGAPP